jgi:hypothetical protein
MATPNPHPQKPPFLWKGKKVDKHLVKRILEDLGLHGFKTYKPSKIEKK